MENEKQEKVRTGLKAQKTPTERMNDVVAEAAENVQTLMRRVMENVDGEPLSGQVAMLCGLADATNKLNFRAEPYDFTSVMGKIMAQGPVAALAPKADKTKSEGEEHGEREAGEDDEGAGMLQPGSERTIYPDNTVLR